MCPPAVSIISSPPPATPRGRRAAPATTRKSARCHPPPAAPTAADRRRERRFGSRSVSSGCGHVARMSFCGASRTSATVFQSPCRHNCTRRFFCSGMISRWSPMILTPLICRVFLSGNSICPPHVQRLLLRSAAVRLRDPGVVGIGIAVDRQHPAVLGRVDRLGRDLPAQANQRLAAVGRDGRLVGERSPFWPAASTARTR